MTPRLRLTMVMLAIAGFACARSTSSNPTVPPSPNGSGAVAAPAPTPPPGPPAAAPAGPPGAPPSGRRSPPTPEQRAAYRASLDAARAEVVAAELARIKGREDSSSQDIFQNLEVLQDTTAGNLLRLMDDYGRALGVGCSFCHVMNKWDDDSKEHKQIARTMIKLTNAINYQQLTMLPKNRRGETPKISCITCHRGAPEPNREILP